MLVDCSSCILVVEVEVKGFDGCRGLEVYGLHENLRAEKIYCVFRVRALPPVSLFWHLAP